jgi:hypothetical protein
MDDDSPLIVDELQRQVTLQQIAMFAKANPDPEAQEEYQALAAAVANLKVPASLIPRLTAILEISLSGERIRKTSGPGAHLALMALFQKTARGKALAAEVAALNAALGQLKNQELTEINAAQRGPGIYTLTIGTPACKMIIRFESDGVRIESVELGAE